MESYLHTAHFDLVTPDGKITKLESLSNTSCSVEVVIEGISPAFRGFKIDVEECVHFNIKSTLAQLGLHAKAVEINLDNGHLQANLQLLITAIGAVGQAMLKHLSVGAYIGKLFASDSTRIVRNPDYLYRMFNRLDRWGNPLLSLGGMQGSQDLLIETIEGRAVAYLSLTRGTVQFEDSIFGLLPTIGKALQKNRNTRELVALHQYRCHEVDRIVKPNEILLVKTPPLHIRTVFARVVDSFLPKGYYHTSANILEPTTQASGDIYELFGASTCEITDIPLEFFTLEPHREHVFFADRDQLLSSLENPESLFEAFATAPGPREAKTAVFVVKGSQMLSLTSSDWIKRNPTQYNFPGIHQETRQAWMVQRYLENQPSYPFWKAIEDGLITSQGILLSRYFPSPLMKRMLLGYHVHQQLKGIYFQYPSLSNEHFFSQEDRALLNDLHKFGIPVYWVDDKTHNILQYAQKQGKDSGLFVPIHLVKDFLEATIFGIYGSNLIEGDFEDELERLLIGIQEIQKTSSHELLSPKTPLALVTGGGPGVMEVGNRVAQKLKILSCANIVDFRAKGHRSLINEQLTNSHIQAKMTYTLDKIVERQAEFQLDFPLFLVGGMGTDFEFSLEQVRRKVGSTRITPVLLCGKKEYWREKISYAFQCNLNHGTIKGSEWISNCFYSIETAEQGLEVYRRFFNNTLPIGPTGPIYKEGFCSSL